MEKCAREKGDSKTEWQCKKTKRIQERLNSSVSCDQKKTRIPNTQKGNEERRRYKTSAKGMKHEKDRSTKRKRIIIRTRRVSGKVSG